MNPEELEGLSAKAQEKNKIDEIVGILLLSGNQSIQVLEGPVRYVNKLYRKIIQDKRHENVEFKLDVVLYSLLHDARDLFASK